MMRTWLGRCLVLAALLLGVGGACLQGQGTCLVSDIQQLHACLDNLADYTTVALTQDVVCTDDLCCNLRIVNQARKVLDGNGYRLTRSAPEQQRRCSALTITATSGITVQNLTVDEQGDGVGCPAPPNPEAPGCAATVRVLNSVDTAFHRFTVLHAKAYAVAVDTSAGLVFDQESHVDGSGLQGLYIVNTRPIRVADSHFTNVATNALFVALADGVIENNVFRGNHHHGRYRCGEGVCPGGQVLLQRADHLLFRRNVVRNGWCDNCINHAVQGLELSNGTNAALDEVEITENVFENNSYAGIFYSGAGQASATCFIHDNTFVNNGFDVWAPGCASAPAPAPTTRPPTRPLEVVGGHPPPCLVGLGRNCLR